MPASLGIASTDIFDISAFGAGATAGASAWSPTAAQQALQQSQQGYSPSHASNPATTSYGQAAGQGYSYTGAGQSGADPAHQQADQADRYIVANKQIQMVIVDMVTYNMSLS